MAYKYIKVDDDGYFVEDVILDHPYTNDDDEYRLISEPIPPGFYLPRWTGSEWVEGLSQQELNDIVNKPKVPYPSEVIGDRIVQLELENLQLRQSNTILGYYLVEMELQLIQLEKGGSD